jgi:hypothetical protein
MAFHTTLSPQFTTALILLSLALTAATHPFSPSSSAPFPAPTPLVISHPTPALLARQWEWASIPAWYTPQLPQPTSTPAATHVEHKDNLSHEIIAVIIVSIFLGLPILACVGVAMYRKCWVKTAKKRGRVTRGRRWERGSERKRVFSDGEYVTRLTERPDMVYWAKDRR